MTLQEAIEITNNPFFYPSYRDREQKMEAIQTMAECCKAFSEGEVVLKEDLIRKLKWMEQCNTKVPDWVWDAIRSS